MNNKSSMGNMEETYWYRRIWEGEQKCDYNWDIIVAEVDRLALMINLNLPHRILDVACGSGGVTIEMASRGFQVTGLDLSQAMLKNAKCAAKKRGVNVNWQCIDMKAISYNSEYDIVMVRDVIFGIFDRNSNDRILDSLIHALRPGGKLLLEVYNKTAALTQGIERKLFYNENSDLFEGTIVHKSHNGHMENLRASMDLRTEEEWKYAFEARKLEKVWCRSNEGKDCSQSQIIIIGGQKPLTDINM